MSDDKKPSDPTTSSENDKELADLLDSALGDFSKEPEKKTAVTDEAAKEKEVEVTGEEGDWTEDFVRQASEQFESNVSRMLSESNPTSQLSQEQIQLSLQRMAEAAQQVLANPTEMTDTSTDFASAITQTLQSLSEGTENLQNPFSDRDIMNMFTGQAPGGGEQNGFLPFMQGMMQSLLSKEVLYPSLKDILEKYPDWIEKNEATLTPADKLRYELQQKLMQDVCKELESENEADSVEVKKQRFESVLSLMQKLQDYGQPPVELVGDVGPGLQFDTQGNPEQCSMM